MRAEGGFVPCDAVGTRIAAELTHELTPKWADYADRTRASWTLMIDEIARLVE